MTKIRRREKEAEFICHTIRNSEKWWRNTERKITDSEVRSRINILFIITERNPENDEENPKVGRKYIAWKTNSLFLNWRKESEENNSFLRRFQIDE